MSEPTNTEIAAIFEEVSTLLSAQDADPFRIRAWQRAAEVIRGETVSLGDRYRAEGIAGLEAMPGIGYRLARAAVEVLRTGTSSTLERLHGTVHAAQELARAPGIGEVLADRIHHELGISTLAQLQAAARDGRLAEVPGIGERRLQTLRDAIEALVVDEGDHPQPEHHHRPPSVATLLEVDQIYRDRAAANTLARIAPKHHNPEGKAWLPVLHLEREGWSFTALFSNTELAHELHKTADWVVLHYEHDHTHGQATVVTEWRGKLSGRRVVRGHEAQCAAYYRAHPDAPTDQTSWGDGWDR